MRIIAGERRGHRIEGPAGREVRPTSDFVREAIFNILRDDVDGRIVFDVFAGTGALGLEALSRGAARAVFVERDRASAHLIRKNLEKLRFEHRGSILAMDAYRWARAFQAIDPDPALVLIDPPYEHYEKHPEKVRQLVGELVERLPAGSILVVESGQPLGEEALPDPALWEPRKYGGTHLAIRTLDLAPERDEAAADADREPAS